MLLEVFDIRLVQERYVPSLVLAMRIAKLFNEPVEGVFTLED